MSIERLFTPEGGFVTEVTLPPFVTKPEVLIWGARVFVHVDSFDPEAAEVEAVLELPFPTDSEDGCYVEAFGYYVPPTPEELAPARQAGDAWEEFVANVRPLVEGEVALYDRVYVDPAQSIGQECSRACICDNLTPGYHWTACPVTTWGLLNGYARQVYMRDKETRT